MLYLRWEDCPVAETNSNTCCNFLVLTGKGGTTQNGLECLGSCVDEVIKNLTCWLISNLDRIRVVIWFINRQLVNNGGHTYIDITICTQLTRSA